MLYDGFKLSIGCIKPIISTLVCHLFLYEKTSVTTPRIGLMTCSCLPKCKNIIGEDIIVKTRLNLLRGQGHLTPFLQKIMPPTLWIHKISQMYILFGFVTCHNFDTESLLVLVFVS